MARQLVDIIRERMSLCIKPPENLMHTAKRDFSEKKNDIRKRTQTYREHGLFVGIILIIGIRPEKSLSRSTWRKQGL